MNLRIARYVDRWVGLVICFGLWAFGRVLGWLGGRTIVPGLLATTPPHGGLTPVPRRALGIKFYGLGNIAMILPTLQALRDAGDVEIDFLTLPGNAGLLEQSGLVARVLSVEVGSFASFVRSVRNLNGALRSGGYDAVLDFEQFMKLSGIFGFWTGAGARVGFNTEGQARGWLYTHRIAYADTDHMADIFMRLVKPFGRAIEPAPRVRLQTSDAEHGRVDELLARAFPGTPPSQPLIAMHVGTGPNYDEIALKRWDAERFAALADLLVVRHGARIAFTGVGAEEAELVGAVLTAMRHSSSAVSLCDVLGVADLLALLERSSFVASNDTAVMHLAGLVSTPVAAFFGPTEPRIYGPRGERDLVFYQGLYCSPCLSNYNLKMSRCVDPVCMRAIEVDEVARRIEAHFFPSSGAAAVGG